MKCRGCSQSCAEQVARRCMRETRVDEMSPLAKDIALIAIAEYPDGEVDPSAYRKAIKERLVKERKCGFFFTVFVLPLMISLISGWVLQWFTNRKTDLESLRASANESL